jgi:hypothetical protein
MLAALLLAGLVVAPTTSVALFLPFVAYLAFVLQWTFASHLGVASTAGGLLRWVFELFAAVLAGAYLWELCDALGTERWRRVSRTTPTTVPASGPAAELPFVSLHVPAHNEPPDMVIQTLESLLRLAYPRYEARTSGASPRTPNCRCACCGPVGPDCTSTSPGAGA